MYTFGHVVHESTSVVDSDAQTFITNALITDATQQEAVNDFVTDAKLLGIWNDLETIYPFIGGAATPHRYNIKTGAADGTFYGGVTHNSDGVTFNGTTGYFDTGWSTNAGNLYDRHYSQYVASQTSNGSWTGSFDGVNVFGMRIDSGRTLSFCGFNNLTEGVISVNIDRSAVSCVTIDSNLVGKLYNNGSLISTNSTAIGATPTAYTVFVGALNSSGSAAFFQDSNVRFVTTGKKLDATKQVQLNSLVRKFNATISR